MDDDCGYRCNEEIKTLVVIARETVQKVGDLEITAPIGVGIDIETGKLTVPVRLKVVGEPVLQPKILENKLINEGFIPAKLIVEKDDNPCCDVGKELIQKVFIPFQLVQEIIGIKPGDDIQEEVKVESASVMGVPVVNPCEVAGSTVKLILKVILKVKIVISRECLVTISACDVRCK